MRRPILRWGDSVLHSPATLVETFDAALDELIDDLIDTMHAAPGIGIAAPQVGVPWRVFVVDLSVGRSASDLLVFVNPVFVERQGLQLEEEGCLSVPGFNATVPRPTRAIVRGLDREGREHVVEGTGLLARAFQHEMDHLDGRLFVDRVRPLRRHDIARRVRRLAAQGRW